MTLIHKVEYLVPGILFPEEYVHTISHRDPVQQAREASENVYCFSYYDVEEAPDLGDEFTVTAKPKNESGRYYIGGDLFTIDDIELMVLKGDVDRTLLSNMQGNWPEAQIIRCRTGNWQPFFPDKDMVVQV